MSPATQAQVRCFAATRGEIKKRIDPQFHSPRNRLAMKALLSGKFPPVPLGALSPTIVGGATPKKGGEGLYADHGIKFLRIVNIKPNELSLEDVAYITPAVHEGELARSKLAAGDVLMTITGRVGSAAVVPKSALPANINQHIVRLRVDPERCHPEYLAAYLNTSLGRIISNRPVTGGTRIALDYDAIRDIPIPLPSLSRQDFMVADLTQSQDQGRRLSHQAAGLLASLDAFVLDILGIRLLLQKPQSVFALHLSQIQGPLDPKRYASLQTERLFEGQYVKDVCHVLDRKLSPARAMPSELVDLIRIDEMPNEPLNVEQVQTVPAEDLHGQYFEVKEGDILLARLGPTIINRKFVLCPTLQRRTVASGEFLVLRCKPEYEPSALLAILRTPPYRDLIYSKARGATPSRYRVSRADILKLPFPRLRNVQPEIVAEVYLRRAEARKLRQEAEQIQATAQARFERRLLGEET